MKPFNLEAAQRGEPVCTRLGHKVDLWCFDFRGGDDSTSRYLNQTIYGRVKYASHDYALGWRADGTTGHCISTRPTDTDLFMASRTEKRWVVSYMHDGAFRAAWYQVHPSLSYLESTHPDWTQIQINEREIEV